MDFTTQIIADLHESIEKYEEGNYPTLKESVIENVKILKDLKGSNGFIPLIPMIMLQDILKELVAILEESVFEHSMEQAFKKFAIGLEDIYKNITNF